MTVDVILFALLLFSLRVLNYTISTIRLVFISRGLKLFAAMMAFTEAFIFAVVMASVVSDLNNIANLLAYCGGAAFGSYLGMWLEGRLFTRYSTATIITRKLGREIAEALRDGGFGATLSMGEGREGEVAIIRSSTLNNDLPSLMDIVRDINPSAFIEVESATVLRRGWIPGGPPARSK